MENTYSSAEDEPQNSILELYPGPIEPTESVTIDKQREDE